MVERLKRWESPRKRGRNDKGKGGSARARQLRKREQMLKQKLRENRQKQKGTEREIIPSLFFGNLADILKLLLQTSSHSLYFSIEVANLLLLADLK